MLMVGCLIIIYGICIINTLSAISANKNSLTLLCKNNSEFIESTYCNTEGIIVGLVLLTMYGWWAVLAIDMLLTIVFSHRVIHNQRINLIKNIIYNTIVAIVALAFVTVAIIKKQLGPYEGGIPLCLASDSKNPTTFDTALYLFSVVQYIYHVIVGIVLLFTLCLLLYNLYTNNSTANKKMYRRFILRVHWNFFLFFISLSAYNSTQFAYNIYREKHSDEIEKSIKEFITCKLIDEPI